MEVEIIKIILAFIVLINPSAALAMFVNFTHGYSYEDKRRVARIASATVFIAIAFFSLFGEIMLRWFGHLVGVVSSCRRYLAIFDCTWHDE